MSIKLKGSYTTPNGVKLVMDFNALCEFEALSGKKAMSLFAEMDTDNASFSDIRMLISACAKRHNPEHTIEDAGDLFADYPDCLEKLLLASIPDVPESGDAGNEPKATKAKKA